MRCCSSSLHFCFILAMEEAEEKQVGVGVGRGIKVAGKREIQVAAMDRVPVFCKTVAMSMFDLIGVGEGTSRALNVIYEGVSAGLTWKAIYIPGLR